MTSDVEEFLDRRTKLSGNIAQMDEFQIRGLSFQLARDRLDLLRQAMIAAIAHSSLDGLSSWEFFANGFMSEDRTLFNGACESDESSRSSLRYLLSEFEAPEEENLDCLPPDISQQIEEMLTHIAGCADQADFPEPEAYYFDPSMERDSDTSPMVDRRKWHNREVSSGSWLATQQELKMKDFVIAQLTRQLGFERGRGEWLTSEHHWREHRERHVKWFTNRSHDVDNVRRRMQDVRTEVEMFMGEDHHVEESYRSNSVNFWMGEASCLDELYHDIERQTPQMCEGMTADEHVEYEAHLTAAFRQLQNNFNTRRSEAAQHQFNEMQILHRHHDKVRRRHLHTIAQMRQDADDYSSDESCDEDSHHRRTNAARHSHLLEMNSPPASADHDWNITIESPDDDDGEAEDGLSEMTTCEPFSDEHSSNSG